MSEKTYHIVQVMTDRTSIQSIDLFVDDEEGAKQLFKEKIKAETNKIVPKDLLEEALEQGYYNHMGAVILITEPNSIFGEE